MTTYTVYHIKLPKTPIYKGYIGITKDYDRRKKQHIWNSVNNKQSNPKLYNAMYKHKEKILFEVLHTNLSLEDALSCEQFYRPLPDIGWNLRAGGGDIATVSKETKTKLSKALTGRVLSTEHKEKLKIPVICIELNKTFESAKDAKHLADPSNISQVCRGNRATAGGYTWKYETPPLKKVTKRKYRYKYTPKKPSSNETTLIYNITKQKLYKTYREAAIDIGLKSVSGIAMACTGKRNLAANCKWTKVKRIHI